MDESNYDTIIPKGSQCITIVELVYISITAKISCKWKLVQAKVFQNQKAITNYAIDDSDEDDTNENDDNGLKEDLESENSDNLVQVDEHADAEVEELAEELQETNIEDQVSVQEEQVEKPAKKGRKKN
jgi:hypothetical protein